MLRLFIASLAFVPLSAAGLPAEQNRLARIFITLVRAEQHCPHLRINNVAFAKEAKAAGVADGALDPPNGPFYKEAVTHFASVEAEFGSQSDQDFCEFMEDGFGPGGGIADGFLKRR